MNTHYALFFLVLTMVSGCDAWLTGSRFASYSYYSGDSGSERYESHEFRNTTYKVGKSDVSEPRHVHHSSNQPSAKNLLIKNYRECITFRPADGRKIRIVMDDDSFVRTTVEKVGDTVIIDGKDSIFAKSVTIYVPCRTEVRINDCRKMRGMGKIDAHLQIHHDNISDFNADGLEFSTLSILNKGMGDVKITGCAKNVFASTYGSGDIRLKGNFHCIEIAHKSFMGDITLNGRDVRERKY